MMTGIVKNILANKNFGFIRDSAGVEYFFHREDFLGDWDDLTNRINNGKQRIVVRFEESNTPKGARASNVTMV